jgi:hypothetical protein
MAIALQMTAYNGEPLTYGRVTDLVVDYQTNAATVTLSGFTSREARLRGEKPIAVLTASFTMPTPVPEDILAYCYGRLAAAHPTIDFTEI